MSRSNAKVSECFSAATGLTDAEAKKLGDLADKYGTGDITGDYVSAIHDILDQNQRLHDAITAETGKLQIHQARVANPDVGKETAIPDGVKFVNATHAATWLATNSKSQYVRDIAAKLAPYLEGVTAHHVSDTSGLHPEVQEHFENNARGLFAKDPSDGSKAVYVHDVHNTEEVWLHEVLHAAINNRMYDGSPLQGEISKLAARVRGALDTYPNGGWPINDRDAAKVHEFYKAVFKDPDEFMAYALTSPTFQTMLSKLGADGRWVKAAPEAAMVPVPKLTMWQKLSDAVRRVFGIDEKYTPQVRSALFANKIRDQANKTNAADAAAKGQLKATLRDYLSSLTEERPVNGREQGKSETGAPGSDEVKTSDSGKLEAHANSAFTTATVERGESAYQKTEDYAKELAKNLPTKTREAQTNIAAGTTKAGMWARTDNQLANDFAKDMPGVKVYAGVKHVMATMAADLKEKADVVAQQLRKLPTKIQDQLNSVMHDATMYRIHPDLPLADKENAHLTDAEKAKYPELQRRFNAMTSAAKDAYFAARDSLKADRQRTLESFNDVADYAYSKLLAEATDPAEKAKMMTERDELKDFYKNSLDEVKGPYFPLMRFGDYLAIGESKQLLALKDQLEGASGKEAKDLQAQMDDMRKDKNHYQVAARNTMGERDTALKAMSDQGLEVRKRMTSQHLEGLRMSSGAMMTKLMHAVDGGFDKEIGTQLKQVMTEMMLRDLPEMHALRREAMREGVHGADQDMIRSFAASSNTNAHYVSRMKNSAELSESMEMMRERAEESGDAKLQLLHREMEKRAVLDMQPSNPTPVQDFLGKASWLWHFAASPSFMVVHAAQPWVMSLPVIAGRYGMGRAFGHLTSAHADALKIMKAGKFDGNKVLIDLRSGINEHTVPDPAERAALHELLNRQVIGGTMQSDLQHIANGDSATISKAMKWSSIMAQETESFSRMATALAAFRSARDGMELGASPDGNHLAHVMAAVDYAHRVTIDTQADATAGGTSRMMRNGGGIPMAKLVTQFRNFQQKALYTFATHLSNAELGGLFKGEAASAEAKVARATLGYLAACSGMAAGAMGMPAADAAFYVANKFTDSDDPRGPMEIRLQNYLTEMFGHTTAEVLTKGIPAAFGADMSKRIGTGDVVSPFKFLNTAGMRTGQENMGAAALAAMGPVGGMASNAYDAFQRFQAGDYARGVEKMSPKVVMDMLKGARYANDGITDGKGLPTGTELGAGDIAMRALGVSPTAESNYYEASNAIKGAEDAHKQKMGNIANHYMQALGGKGDMADVREAINKFNDGKPRNLQIDSKLEQQWRKTYRDDSKNRQPGSGVKMPTKKLSDYGGMAEFAG